MAVLFFLTSLPCFSVTGSGMASSNSTMATSTGYTLLLINSNILLLNQNHLQATAHHGIHAIGKGKIQSKALEAG